ncbi:ribosome maturation factor RimM [Stakelama pacifica]|uniref:Ribosome maturation factor RimM n=1 Tax=Stakelama pacifica TaxID=517720 RepID=A0A4R6FF62_9SPHN|nr:ribosome maturation factor RimM [Stakelama pacifica]TDN79926.1 16S rRNA processing protein RimM [Stakelama pacifica]GGO98232.1 ribosome maturation factor RimM [Stakelama pacifica]
MSSETNPPPAASKRQDRPVTLAVAIGAHGVAGEVRLKVFAEDLGAHKSFNNGTLTLKKLRDGTNGMIARFAEVADRSAAEKLRGTELTVPRSALPPLEEGEYYHVDLLGLPVIDEDGMSIGTVVAIEDFGAGDVIEIERPNGKRFMVPMRDEAVPDWNEDRLIVSAAFAEG